MKTGAEKYLPLTEATYLILAALAEPRHGYGIMQVVAEVNGGMKLGPGTLYGALTKLLDQALIERAGESATGDGERRKMYRLTALGRRVVELESERLALMAELGRRLLSAAGGMR